ncbi:MAG: helix-turn-helix transcriptional regulator, partial [Alphaproteobacteria bacterium]|nr:helix-turn-helix transcriptional regulator [Alphaproteobacteria bacterium]
MRYVVYQLSHNWRLNCATVWVCHTAPGKYMASRDSLRGVCPNGPRIKELRKRAGFSQRDFAARFAITARTLQRAESGERVLPEMLNSIAAGLKVASSELDIESMESSTGSTWFEPHYEQVRLPRTATARQIAAVLAQVQQLTFEYDIDPDEKTAEDVAAAMEIMERLVGKSG